MTVQIPADLEAYIDEKVRNGEFESRQSFVSEVVRLFRTMEMRHAELRQMIAAGRDQLARGEAVVCEDEAALKTVFDEIKRRGRETLSMLKATE